MSNNDNHSNHTLTTIREKEQDSIPFRIEFIKELLKDKMIDPMIDLDDTNTENFIYMKGGNNYNKNDIDDDSCDTRIALNKKIHDFNKAISQIGGDLMYIKSGTTGHTFKGVINGENDSYNYAVKVVAYPKKEKYGGIHDAKRPENAELMMIKLLSYFVINKQTPHIVLPIGTFNTNIKPFIDIVNNEKVIDKQNEKYKSFVERYEHGDYYGKVSILISEWANRGDLLDFIRKNYRKFKLLHWKVFFFQILSVLAIIQYKFPSFRHNDMKANNILVHKISKTNTSFTYKVVGKTYIVQNIGYIIKLWDFDFACIPGIVNNNKVSSDWTKAINVTPQQNRYYDIHYFFNTLIKKGFFPQFMTEKCIPQEAKDFVDRIVPNKYKEGRYIHKRGRILVNDEYYTPDEILKKDPFFEEFRKTSKPVKSEKKDLNNIKNIDNKIQNEIQNEQESKNKIKQMKNEISIDDLLMNYSD
jgi:hypothetical protein